ncbi:hypothetical protein KJ633_03725 [bacterium]|nr:hypothetical protein [bacterium]MBU3955548.1 hypothetical protein [bacterium]
MKKCNSGNAIVHSTLESGEDVIVNDRWEKEYHFKVASFPVPTGLASEAVEVTKDDSPGRIFRILSDYNTDPEDAMEMIMEKVCRGINRRHLKKYNGKWEIGGRNILRGAIEYNDDFSDTSFERVFVIDGKRITIEKFTGMLDQWEGWNFKFKIMDAYGEDA